MTHTPDQIARAREIFEYHSSGLLAGDTTFSRATCERMILAAIAATEAHVTERIEATANVEPDWWFYQSKSSGEWFMQPNRANMDRRYWTVTPLYAGPPQALLQEAREVLTKIERRTSAHPDDTPKDHARDKYHANAYAGAFLTKLDAALGERP